MRAAIVALGAIVLLLPLSSFSAGADEDALRARVLFVPAGFSNAVISPDGSSLMYLRRKPGQSDIMLAEGFR